MAEGPINPDREQQHADNLASARQSHIGPLPAELEQNQDEEPTDAHQRKASEASPEAADDARDQGSDSADAM